jgi:hypothetical protein
MQLVQVKLRCENTYLQTHIDFRFKKKTIKAGMIVELKDDSRLWTVEQVYGNAIEKGSIKRGWHNGI